MPRCRVGPHDVPISVQREQAVAVVAGLVTGPVQAQHQGMRGGQQPAVFNAAGRAAHQVFQGRALGGFDARQVQHAGAQAVRTKNRCPSAAVHAVVIEEMFSSVQPDWLQFGQGGADGSGAHRAF